MESRVLVLNLVRVRAQTLNMYRLLCVNTESLTFLKQEQAMQISPLPVCACTVLRFFDQRNFKSWLWFCGCFVFLDFFCFSSLEATGQSPSVHSNFLTFFCTSLLLVKWAYRNNREMTVAVQSSLLWQAEMDMEVTLCYVFCMRFMQIQQHDTRHTLYFMYKSFYSRVCLW